MPGDMPPAAEATWKALAPMLQAANLVAELDGTALRLLCESVYIYTEATDEIRRDGVTIDEKRKAHPAVRVRDAAWSQVVKLCQQFGMTPSARTGFDFALEHQGDDDEASDILGFKVVS